MISAHTYSSINAPSKRNQAIAKSLIDHRTDWDAHYEQLEQHFLPRRGLFSGDPVNQQVNDRGKLLNRKMLTSTPMRAKRVLQSGLQTGVSSPSRPWFRFQTLDPELREFAPVKDYVHRMQAEARRLLERSGLYNMLHTGYGDLGVYGTEAAIIEERGDFDLRGVQLTPGSYWLGSTNDDFIDTMYREYGLTINQIVGKFVFKGQRFGDPDWEAVPPHIKKCYDTGDIAKTETVCQLIYPRMERDPRKADGRNKPVASEHWIKNDERDTDKRPLAGTFGYDENPISASRWDVNSGETYGRSPGMEALPDVKELMAKRRDYLELLRRQNRPTMNAHTELRNSAFSFMPGAVNFMADPEKGLSPTFKSEPNFAPLREDIEMTKDEIWSAMYADTFLMISNMPGVQPRNEMEIAERREEKLLQLGPVLERLHFEKLKPLVERLARRVQDSGVLGPPPQELVNQELEIDFISMLAQAQKAVSTGALERYVGFAGNVAGGWQDTLDKTDADALLDEYAEMLGIPPQIVRSDDIVKSIRSQRQQTEQAMMAAEQANQVATAMKTGAEAASVMAQADSPRGAVPGDVLARTGLG